MNLSMEEYVNKYINMVKKVVGIYIKKMGLNTNVDDLYQVGLLGLVESYYSYDSKRGSMSTYVYNCIRYSILKYISQNNYATYVPSDVVHYARIVYNENEKHLICDNRNASLEELQKAFESSYCRRLNFTHKFFSDLINLNKYHINSSILSCEMLADTYNNTDDDKLDTGDEIDNLFSIDNVEEEAVNSVMLDEIFECIEELSEDERIIIKYVFGLDGYPMCASREIGKKMGISHQTVCKKYNKSIRKIRRKLNI